MSRDFIDRNSEVHEGMNRLGLDLPAVMKGFGGLHAAVSRKGSLPSKTKELISLGIAITVRCDGCIAFHVHDALEAGATREEILETIGVAILMGGGPSVVYGADALEALDQFLSESTRKAG